MNKVAMLAGWRLFTSSAKWTFIYLGQHGYSHCLNVQTDKRRKQHWTPDKTHSLEWLGPLPGGKLMMEVAVLLLEKKLPLHKNLPSGTLLHC
jgi:hypothetical protein